MKRTEKQLQKIGLGVVRVSQRGTPHLVMNGKSVAWFAKTKTYRVFWPWPSYEKQEKRDFKNAEDVRAFLLELEFADEDPIARSYREYREKKFVFIDEVGPWPPRPSLLSKIKGWFKCR